ncbi:MAG: type II toxin-antitoxin system RelE/ParE family toxin [Pseudomonadota bacterium]
MKLTQILQLDDGSEPFTEWLESLELRVQARVSAFIDRVALGGGKKNVRALGEGVYEIKIDIGPGYRVYFGEDGKRIILLLVGGDKGTQAKDIFTAKRYWRQYEKK